MARKSLEERLEELKKKQRLVQTEINKKNRKERTHLLVLHGVQIETALKKLGKPLNDIQNFKPELLAELNDYYVKALSSFYTDHADKLSLNSGAETATQNDQGTESQSQPAQESVNE